MQRQADRPADAVVITSLPFSQAVAQTHVQSRRTAYVAASAAATVAPAPNTQQPAVTLVADNVASVAATSLIAIRLEARRDSTNSRTCEALARAAADADWGRRLDAACKPQAVAQLLDLLAEIEALLL
jgi:hypothetical protein